MPQSTHDLVLLIDCDNTILDNDGVKTDIDARLRAIVGDALTDRYWELYESVRVERDVVDIYESMRRLRDEHPTDAPVVDAAEAALRAWDFRPRLYPRAIETLAHLSSLGLTVILSDGDDVFQPQKINESGIAAAAGGRVLIYVHKEQRLPEIMRRYPARHYVLIEDKPGILMRTKAAVGDAVTTVHVRQGKYALDPRFAVDYTPDITVDAFADLLPCTAADLAAAAPARSPAR